MSLPTVALLSALLGMGCNNNTTSGSSSGTSKSSATKPKSSGDGAATSGMDCSTPRKTIESQIAAIKKGTTVKEFRECFTKDKHNGIKQKKLDKSTKRAEAYDIDELYGSEENKGDDKVKVKTKGGRTLTTMVKEGDTWKASTLWYK